jgi:hypothetical protein
LRSWEGVIDLIAAAQLEILSDAFLASRFLSAEGTAFYDTVAVNDAAKR